MKKLQVLFYLFLSLAVITSCEKEDDDDDDDDDVFSELTVEQNKQHLEDDGLAMLDKMQDMENSAAIDVAAAMVHFMDLADPFEGNPNIGKKSTIMSTLKPVIAVAQMREFGNDVLFHALKSAQDEPQSIQEAYDMASGIYAWNNATQVWDYSDSGTEIVFQFPSTKTGTSNNAETKVYGYEGYTGTIGYDLEDYEGDLPENIDISLKADNTTLFTFNFSASYTNEGEPTSVSASMTLDSFSMLVSASNTNNQKAEFLYELKDGSEILSKVVLGAEGNWSADNIDNNTVIEYDTVYYEE